MPVLTRILTPNLNHRTRPMPVAPVWVDAIDKLDVDIVVFNEYVDHVLSRGKMNTLSARYVEDPFVPAHTDHAALLAETAN